MVILDPPMPRPDGPVDETVPTVSVEDIDRPGRFTLMAPGETVEQTLIREVAEEARAQVQACRYLAAQHVADPLNPDGLPSYYQTRWWARVALDPWEPRFEMTGRRLVPPERVLDTLFWAEKQIAGRLLDQAVECDATW